MKEINPQTISPETARAEIEYLYEAGRKAQKASEEGAKPYSFTFGGEEWISHGGRLLRYEKAKPEHIVKPETFNTFSIDGLIDFIRTDVDGYFKDESVKCLVRVSSPEHVDVYTPITGYWKERMRLVSCEATVPEITFNRFMDSEEFQIMLQSNFLPSDNRDLVLKLVGSLRKEQNMETADDGVSQRVTINAGVATAANVTVKNPVILTPIRTFQEVVQPESPFVLRFDENARVALFTGDGGAWKLQAVAAVVEYLRGNLAGYNVEVIG